MNDGFEVGATARFTASHVMPGMPGPEGELHAHDYQIEVAVTRADLDARGMVCDLDVLTEALATVVSSISDQDLDAIRPPGVEAVTVEVLAAWVHAQLHEPVRLAGGERLHVRVWESPDAFGGYHAAID
jgi:6-pyruvoyltetrahydropterin/6-carboxytetrahydropterin synthase